MVLVVDDDQSLRAFAVRALRRQGYHVCEARNGHDAIDLVNDEMPDSLELLLTDITMPKMDGMALANSLREQYPQLKILFMSGYEEEVHEQQLQRTHSSFLQKPFSLHDLIQKVNQVLQS
jgi:two-component system cell cycle sensor histidine kinase/response regulator CckA